MQAVEGTKSLKDAFREMTVSILRDLSRMAMRQAFMNMFGAIFSGAGGMTTAGGTTNMGGGQFMGAGGTAFGMGSAAGNVFNRGNVTAFANGTVISKPTMFPMRGGVGLMGENGPEAIMPLQRGRNGKLGVAGGGITMTNNIVIENGGQMAEDPEKMNKFVTKIGEEIRNQVRAVMVDEQRVNGIFNSPAIRRYA
jgi:lambda family phage tail tape measure protein